MMVETKTRRQDQDPNLELVIAMGSKKGYDPMPPDNYLFFLSSEDEVQRCLAWVRSKTIRKRHRSPWAVAENGTRPLTKADMARECFHGNRANACRAWDRAVAMGLVFANEQGFLCLAGSVKMSLLDRRKKGEPKLSAQTAFRPYQIEKIEALPADARKSFDADYGRLSKYRDALETDALNLARIRADEIEDSIFQHYGIPKRRLDRKHRPDLHEAGSKLLQLELLLVPEELQPYAKFEQTAPVRTAPKVPTDSQNGSSQTAHTTHRTEENPSESPSPDFHHHHSQNSKENEPTSKPKSTAFPTRGDDDETPAPAATEYANGREHLKAIYLAKTNEHISVEVLDRIEAILTSQGKTFEEFADALRPHLGGNWKVPAAFLTDKARRIFSPLAGAPQLKPKPKCPVCLADNQRGAVMKEGAIVPCPACSTPEWVEELNAKTRPKSSGAHT